MKTVKNLLVLVAMMLLTYAASAQFNNDKWFISVGIDPVVASGTNLLAKNNHRVAAGKLNYILQIGIENYQEGKIMPKFGLQFEQFNAINYTSGGVFAGITFKSPKIPLTNLQMGDFWYITPELNLISRKGIEDSRLYNANGIVNWAFGGTLGIRYNKPKIPFTKIQLPFSAEFQFNLKDRADTSTHYTNQPIGIKRIKPSLYTVIVYNF